MLIDFKLFIKIMVELVHIHENNFYVPKTLLHIQPIKKCQIDIYKYILSINLKKWYYWVIIRMCKIKLRSTEIKLYKYKSKLHQKSFSVNSYFIKVI